jgi:hypothetical protein
VLEGDGLGWDTSLRQEFEIGFEEMLRAGVSLQGCEEGILSRIQAF